MQWIFIARPNESRSTHVVRAAAAIGHWARSVALGTFALAAVVFAGRAHAQVAPVRDSIALVGLRETLRLANPELAARRAAFDAATARLRATGFAPAAELSAEIEEVPDAVAVDRAGSARVDLSREFLPGALRDARRELARRDVERAQLDLEMAERRVLARSDQHLTRAISSAAIARRLAAEDSLLLGAAESVRSRFAVADARYVDVLRLRTERLRVRAEGAAAVAEARIGRRSLLALVGASDTTAGRIGALVDSLIGRGTTARADVPLPDAPPLDSLIATAGAVRVASAEVSRAETARRLLRAEQRPTIVASIGAQRFADESGRRTMGPTIGATVSLPFTARRGNVLASEAAEGEVRAADAALRGALAETRAALGEALDRYETARAQLALYDAALLVGAREERESALAAFRTGDLTLIELLDFERALTRAETARLESRIAAADAFADLIVGAAGDIDTGHRTERGRALRARNDQ